MNILLRLLIFMVMLSVWLTILGGIFYVFNFLLSLPMRRAERARLFLDVLETSIDQGQSAETAIVSLSKSQEESVGVRFHLVAAHIENGSRFGEALKHVPRFLPPQICAILQVGEKLGNLKTVLPACREIVSDAKASVQSGYHYFLLIGLVFSPMFVWTSIFIMKFVFPKIVKIAAWEDLPNLPPTVQFSISHPGWFAGAEALIFLFLLLGAIIYIGGPRLMSWVRFGGFPLFDWIAWRLPWNRKRLQRTFSAMLSVLLDGGVPEVESVWLACECTVNEISRARAQQMIDQIKRGVKLDQAVAVFDDAGEFRWRLANATHSRGGFLNALRGWHESLEAKAFQEQETTAHIVTSGLVVLNGVLVALVATTIFGILIAILEGVIVKFTGNLRHRSRREDGAILMLDLIVGISILLIAILPIGYSFYVEGRAFRAEYQHGVAMEIVDGEIEVLAAGEWKAFADGSQPYAVHARAAANLPPGHFQLIKNGNHLRLEWRPDSRNGASFVREVVAK